MAEDRDDTDQDQPASGGGRRARRHSIGEVVAATVGKLLESKAAAAVIAMVLTAIGVAGYRVGENSTRVITLERELAALRAQVLCLHVPGTCAFTMPAPPPAIGAP